MGVHAIIWRPLAAFLLITVLKPDYFNLPLKQSKGSFKMVLAIEVNRTGKKISEFYSDFFNHITHKSKKGQIRLCCAAMCAHL